MTKTGRLLSPLRWHSLLLSLTSRTSLPLAIWMLLMCRMLPCLTVASVVVLLILLRRNPQEANVAASS